MERTITYQISESEHGLRVCLLYTSDAADEEDSEHLRGPRDLKKKKVESGVIKSTETNNQPENHAVRYH